MDRLWQLQCAIQIYTISWRTCPKKASQQSWVTRQPGSWRALDQESLNISQVSFEILCARGMFGLLSHVCLLDQYPHVGILCLFSRRQSRPALYPPVQKLSLLQEPQDESVCGCVVSCCIPACSSVVLFDKFQSLQILIEHISRPALIYAPGQRRLVTT